VFFVVLCLLVYPVQKLLLCCKYYWFYLVIILLIYDWRMTTNCILCFTKKYNGLISILNLKMFYVFECKVYFYSPCKLWSIVVRLSRRIDTHFICYGIRISVYLPYLPTVKLWPLIVRSIFLCDFTNISQ